MLMGNIHQEDLKIQETVNKGKSDGTRPQGGGKRRDSAYK